jgi:hypothetical protein
MGQSFVSHDTTPGVTATNDNSTPQAGPGLLAHSAAAGVVAQSTTWHGVYGTTQSTTGGVGVMGESAQSEGVRGISHAPTHGGVVGINDNQTDGAGPGVYGASRGTGVWGASQTWMGVYGNSQSQTGGAGVMGEGTGPGVIGKSQTGHGVYGETASTAGGAGVWGEHKGKGVGVFGGSSGGIGVYGKGGQLAARFEGDVEVTGDIRLTNADLAEEFVLLSQKPVEPGTVMVLGEEGSILPSTAAYDKRVAGVIAGAGDYKPGIVLDKHGADESRSPVALVGKTFCKVDAGYGAVQIGDLLTTSDTPGCAMKASDPLRAFGAVIGKALRPLAAGRALIPILVALQ